VRDACVLAYVRMRTHACKHRDARAQKHKPTSSPPCRLIFGHPSPANDLPVRGTWGEFQNATMPPSTGTKRTRRRASSPPEGTQGNPATAPPPSSQQQQPPQQPPQNTYSDLDLEDDSEDLSLSSGSDGSGDLLGAGFEEEEDEGEGEEEEEGFGRGHHAPRLLGLQGGGLLPIQHQVRVSVCVLRVLPACAGSTSASMQTAARSLMYPKRVCCCWVGIGVPTGGLAGQC